MRKDTPSRSRQASEVRALGGPRGDYLQLRGPGIPRSVAVTSGLRPN